MTTTTALQALNQIAAMDPEGVRADDLGRAASIARAALSAAQDAPAGQPELKDALVEHLCSEFVSVYDCTRVWEAWGVGTMHESDFVPITDRVDDIADGIIAFFAARASQPTPAQDAAATVPCFAIYRTEDGAESFHAALWHDDTKLSANERYVKGRFVPDAAPQAAPTAAQPVDLWQFRKRLTSSDLWSAWQNCSEEAARLYVEQPIDGWLHEVRALCVAPTTQAPALVPLTNELLAALKKAHEAIDVLAAMVITLDNTFRPSKSPIWPSMVAVSEAIKKAEAAGITPAGTTPKEQQ